MKKKKLSKQPNSYYKLRQVHAPASFSSDISVEAPSQSNGDKMVLRNVRIVEEGEARGHGVWMDKDFIEKTVSLAKGRRIKCRFGHPGMCSESFGTYLGYYDNFRVMQGDAGTYAIADLNLSKAANKSPNGKLSEYIQELANEAPDMFGNSIVFSNSEIFYKTDKGINVYKIWVEDEEDWSSKWVTKDGKDYDETAHGVIDEKKRYTDIVAFHDSDLVDEPAATSSLFSENNVIYKIAEVFGLNMGGRRKTVLLKQLITELNNMAKLSINATIADGSGIVVNTENDYIGIGDTVTDSQGDTVQDGSYDITESDSGQSGITITTADGKITRIEPTATQSSSESSQQEEGDNAQSEELSAMQKSIRALTGDVTKLQSQMQQMLSSGMISKVQFDALTARVDVIEKRPAAERTVVVEENESAAKKTYKSKYLKD